MNIETSICSLSHFRRVHGDVFVNVQPDADNIIDVKVTKRDLISALRYLGHDRIEYMGWDGGDVKFIQSWNSKNENEENE